MTVLCFYAILDVVITLLAFYTVKGDLMTQYVANIKIAVDLLHHSIEALVTAIHGCSLKAALVYSLEDMQRYGEGETIASVIPVAHEDWDGRALAIQSFRDIYIAGDSQHKIVRRYPGFVHLAGDSAAIERLLGAVADINRAKDQLQDAIIASGTTAHQRFTAARVAAPGLVTLAAYRLVPSVIEDVYSIGWSWASRSVTSRIDKSTALTKLAEIGATESYAVVEKLPEDAKLRIKRPMRLQPLVNIRLCSGEAIQRVACLPLLLVGASNPVIHPLPDYAGGSSRPFRNILVAEELSLYLIEDVT